MRITGNMINYYFVCHRKLWFFAHGLQYEMRNENVQLGKLLEEQTYRNKRKQVMIDGNISVDFIDNWKIVHEVKKSKAIEESAVWQVRYYLYYLRKKQIAVQKGYLDYPKLRERIEVTLNQEHVAELEGILTQIERIVMSERAPVLEKKKICLKCAYYDYCFS